MTYDPIAYWQRAGADPTVRDHETNFVRTPVFQHPQEGPLLGVLERLDGFGSILEVGCGWGRITKLVHERWPNLPYTAIDLSPERLQSAAEKVSGVEFIRSTIQGFRARRKWDLVLSVETLMHVPPAEIQNVVDLLVARSRKYVVTLDWNTDLGGKPVSSHNFLFDYPDLFRPLPVTVTQIDRQGIHVAEVRGTPVEDRAD